jgi:hypothetical protein
MKIRRVENKNKGMPINDSILLILLYNAYVIVANSKGGDLLSLYK